MNKVGVLLPRSGIFPLLSSDFLAGINSFLKRQGLEGRIKLFSESIGLGADKKEIYQKTEKLLVLDQVDLVIAFIDQITLDTTFPLIDAIQKPFIVINAGANYASNWIPPDPMFFLTLQDGLLSRLISLQALNSGFSKCAYAVSYYDGGYHHGHAMVAPYLAKGGEIVFNYVSQLRTADFTVEPLINYLAESPVKSILGIFSGDESNRFLEKMDQAGFEELKLFVSPQMLEEQTLSKLHKPLALELQGFVPWHSTIDTIANRSFMSSILEDAGRAANIFSLLGWEAGLLIAQLQKKGATVIDALNQNGLDTPRGKLMLDAHSHHLIGPAYAVQGGKGNQLGLTGSLSAEACMDEWRQLMDMSETDSSSGWTNTYLCY